MSAIQQHSAEIPNFVHGDMVDLIANPWPKRRPLRGFTLLYTVAQGDALG